jgi:hypothetical protein
MNYNFFLLFLLFSFQSQSQEKAVGSLYFPAATSSVSDSLKSVTLLPDSLHLQQRLDSLHVLSQRLDTLSLRQQLDSLGQIMQKLSQCPDTLQRLQAKADSLQNLLQYSQQLNQQLVILQQKVLSKSPAGVDQGLAKLGIRSEMLPDRPQASLPAMPDPSLPQLPTTPSTAVPNLKLPGSTEIGEGPQLNLPIEGLPQLPQELAQAKELLQTAKQLQPDSLMQSDKTDELIAQQLARQEEFAYFQEQKELPKESLEQALPKPQDYNRKAVIQKAVELTPEQLRKKKQQMAIFPHASHRRGAPFLYLLVGILSECCP